MLAVLEYREGKCETAVGHFEKTGTLLDSELDALHAYGTCLVRLKQRDAAIAVFQRAVALRPDDASRAPPAGLDSADGFETAGRHRHAEPNPRRRAQPTRRRWSSRPAPTRMPATPRSAVSTLRQAILLDPRNPNLYVDFANIAFAHQSFQVGIDVVTDGIGLQPQAAPLYVARGVLYVQLAEYDKAEADFEKANELDPSQSLSSAAQGLAAVEANDLDRALATVQQRLARKPDDPLLLYVRGRHPRAEGRRARHAGIQDGGVVGAAARWRSGRRSRPAHGVLAKLYLQAGQTQAAIDQCRKALAIDPNDQTSVYRLIQALRKTGDKSEIPALLKRLAQLREQSAQQERERNRYKLVEGDRTAVRTMTVTRRAFVRLSLASAAAASVAADRVLAQGIASHTAKPLARPAPSGRPFPARFVDVASAAGLTAPVVYGAREGQKYILEAVGCGCAFIDYDNDGWMDIFLLSGTRLEGDPPKARAIASTTTTATARSPM